MAKVKPHPLDETFNVDPTPDTEPVAAVQTAPSTALVLPSTGRPMERTENPPEADVAAQEERIEDLAIDKKLEQVHTVALEAFQSQFRLSQEVEPRFSARNAEVAAQYLKIALETVNSRVDSKYKRNKIKIAQDKKDQGDGTPGGKTVIIADRNEILKALGGRVEKPVDGETITLEPSGETR